MSIEKLYKRIKSFVNSLPLSVGNTPSEWKLMSDETKYGVIFEIINFKLDVISFNGINRGEFFSYVDKYLDTLNVEEIKSLYNKRTDDSRGGYYIHYHINNYIKNRIEVNEHQVRMMRLKPRPADDTEQDTFHQACIFVSKEDLCSFTTMDVEASGPENTFKPYGEGVPYSSVVTATGVSDKKRLVEFSPGMFSLEEVQ